MGGQEGFTRRQRHAWLRALLHHPAGRPAPAQRTPHLQARGEREHVALAPTPSGRTQRRRRRRSPGDPAGGGMTQWQRKPPPVTGSRAQQKVASPEEEGAPAGRRRRKGRPRRGGFRAAGGCKRATPRACWIQEQHVVLSSLPTPRRGTVLHTRRAAFAGLPRTPTSFLRSHNATHLFPPPPLVLSQLSSLPPPFLLTFGSPRGKFGPGGGREGGGEEGTLFNPFLPARLPSKKGELNLCLFFPQCSQKNGGGKGVSLGLPATSGPAALNLVKSQADKGTTFTLGFRIGALRGRWAEKNI